MQRLTVKTYVLSLLALVLLANADGSACWAAPADDHSHTPIVVPSKPVIERIPVQVVQPADTAVSVYDEIFVVDSSAGILFRLDSDHVASVLLKDKRDLCRVAVNKSEIVVLQAHRTRGQLLRVTETGFEQTIASLGFRPCGLALDTFGKIWTTNPKSRTVLQLDHEGRVLQRVTVSATPVDLLVNKTGQCTVLLETGALVNVFSDGSTSRSGVLPAGTKRIQFDSGGAVVGLFGDDIPELFHATGDSEQTKPVARTMMGTTAFAYDRLGNLVLASPDLRAITKVTSHFEVPCPHCGQLVPMTFSTAVPRNPKQRSF